MASRKGAAFLIKDDLTDEELLYLIEAGSDSAKSALFDRYYKRSESIGRYYYKMYRRTGITIEEFTMVAFSKTDEAFKTYRNKRVDFYNYWKVLVRNAIHDYIRHNSFTIGPRSHTVSIDEGVSYDNEPLYLHDVIGDVDEVINDSRSIVNLLNEIVETDKYNFTSEERAFTDLYYVKGYEIEEITEMLQSSINHIYYVAKVVKSKITKIIKDSYL